MKKTNNKKTILKKEILEKPSLQGKNGNVDEKITIDRKIRDEMKNKEQEQTQNLLISLTNELYEKIEKLSPTEENSQQNNVEKNSKKISNSKDSKNEYFSDLSWYRKKLGE